VLKNYLGIEGYNVMAVSGGHEALEIIGRHNFDLALLDVMMPKITGYDVCRRIREKYSIHDLPVLMLTARNGINDLVAGFEAGANDYLTKPAGREELLTRVKTLVTLKKTVGEHREAKYRLLQERMNPHFLFNALNMIHSFVLRDARAADDALLKLAQNYRFLIDLDSRSLVSFEEEWEFVRNYLELEELRFGDTMSFSMEKTGDFGGINLPPLTIQPVVENSLKHGLKNMTGGGRIMVTADRTGNSVRVGVADNGEGLKTDNIYSRSLGNILQRLRHNFVEAELKAENIIDGGVRVSISFCMRTL
jgi:two-component system sensor histidine kinase ChiS